MHIHLHVFESQALKCKQYILIRELESEKIILSSAYDLFIDGSAVLHTINELKEILPDYHTMSDECVSVCTVYG